MIRVILFFFFTAITFSEQAQSIEELRQKAIESYDSKDYKQAIAFYDKIVSINPKDPLVYLDRALAKECINDYEGAIIDYGIGIEVDPYNPDHYFLRALLESLLKRYPQAITDYDKALSIEDDNADAFYKRGEAKAALGKYEEAIRDFDEAIRNYKLHAPAYMARGWAYARIGNYEKCIEDHFIGIEMDTMYISFKNDAPKDLIKQAKKQLQSYYKKFNWKAATRRDWCYAGILKYYYGDYKGALKNFKGALKLNEQYGLALFYKASTLIKLKKPEKAMDDLNKAVASDPGCIYYYLKRAQIKSELPKYKGGVCSDLKKYLELGGDPIEAALVRSCQ